jgi:hypothetical protein
MGGELSYLLHCCAYSELQVSFVVWLMDSQVTVLLCGLCEFSIPYPAMPVFLNGASVLQESSTKKKGRNKEGELCGVTFLSTLQQMRMENNCINIECMFFESIFAPLYGLFYVHTVNPLFYGTAFCVFCNFMH